MTAVSRVYDATLVAPLSTTGVALSGVVIGDAVTLGGTAAGAFASKSVGTSKSVQVSALAISGADAANYTLTPPTTTADITAKTLTVSGLTAVHKSYDGTTAATLTLTGATLVGVVGSDSVTLATGTAAGTFASASVGAAKAVTIAGLALTGADAGNYALMQPAAAADINRATTTVTLGNLAQAYTGAARSVAVTTLPAGLDVALTYAGNPAAPVNAGSYAVIATVSDANYSGSSAGTLIVAKAAQKITLSAPTSATLATAVTLTATASSGLPVTLSVSGPATLSGSALTFNTPGTAIVTATQAGDGNYEPASGTATITAAGKLTQTIAFAPPADRLSNSGASALAATASSGLPVTFAIVSGPACQRRDETDLLPAV